jgi:hypothetical protein
VGPSRVLLSSGVAEVSLDRVEALFPEPPIAGDPFAGRAEGCGLELAAAHPTVLPRFDEPRAFEGGEVLEHGGQGHVEGCGQLAHRRLAGAEAREDRAASGIGQGAERGVETIVNHLVKLSRSPPPVKEARAVHGFR